MVAYFAAADDDDDVVVVSAAAAVDDDCDETDDDDGDAVVRHLTMMTTVKVTMLMSMDQYKSPEYRSVELQQQVVERLMVQLDQYLNLLMELCRHGIN